MWKLKVLHLKESQVFLKIEKCSLLIMSGRGSPGPQRFAATELGPWEQQINVLLNKNEQGYPPPPSQISLFICSRAKSYIFWHIFKQQSIYYIQITAITLSARGESRGIGGEDQDRYECWITTASIKAIWHLKGNWKDANKETFNHVLHKAY